MYGYLIDGAARGAVAVGDRGLHYGDGLFETLAVADGRPLLWRRHLARLEAGCARLGIAMPAAALLHSEAARLCAALPRAVLKIIVTRGAGGRGYAPAGADTPSRILITYPWPERTASRRAAGVAVRVCATRLAAPSALAGLKHLNRLEQVLARGEWHDDGIAEGLMCDAGGRVIEGTMSNVFAVCDGRLVTPDVSQAGVAGVMRALILEAAPAAGIAGAVRPVTLEELAGADEIFLCNSVMGVWPVTSLDARRLPVGAVTRTIAALAVDREKEESR